MKHAVPFVGLGLVGLLLVGRAAMAYRGHDPIALGLVGLIGFGLLVGLLEAMVRTIRHARAISTLDLLPRELSEGDLAAIPGLLGLRVRARLAGQAIGVAPSFAGYLVGLLVLIGLLGTFLGLFETLRGAREALGTSADVGALRAGLASPMQGLSRSFGTSAAGVSASAVLGMAVLLLRRSESQLSAKISAVVAGPAQHLSLQARTLRALEALASQSLALPEAALALREVGAGIARDLALVADSTADAVSSALVAPMAQMVADAHASTGDVATRLAHELRGIEAERSLVAQRRAEESERSRGKEHAETQASLSRLGVELGRRNTEAVDRLVATEASRTAGLTASIETAAQRTFTELGKVAEARDGALLASLQTWTAARELSAAQLDIKLDTLIERLASVAQEGTAQSERTQESLSMGVQTLLAELRTSAESLKAVQQTSARISEDTIAHVRSMSTDIASSQARAQEQAERALLTFSNSLELTATNATNVQQRLFEQASRELGSLNSRWIDQVTGDQNKVAQVLANYAEGATAGLQAFQELSADVRQEFAAQREQTRISNETLVATSHGHLRSIVEHALVSQQTSTQQFAGQLQAIVEQLHVERGEDQRIHQEATASLRTASLAAADSVIKLVETSAGIVPAMSDHILGHAERVSSLIDAAEQSVSKLMQVLVAAESSAHERLSAEAEAYESRMCRMSEELARAEELRGRHLAEALGGQAQALTGQVQVTLAAVADASEVMRGSVAEMMALAELFGGSVDKHHEASERWLTGLNSMRAAAERVAAHDAEDLVSAYLDQTRDLVEACMRLQERILAGEPAPRRHSLARESTLESTPPVSGEADSPFAGDLVDSVDTSLDEVG